MSSALEHLLHHPGVWRGRGGALAPEETLPTGFAILDEALPGGGWPRAALTEVLSAHQGIGELRLLMPALAALTREGRWLAWVDPPYVPYVPALASWGVDLSRLLVVRAASGDEGLWAVEQTLRSGVCGAVLAWSRDAARDGRSLRRLQLASEAGRSWGLLFRSVRWAAEPSPASVRLLVEPAGPGVAVSFLKCRGRGPSAPLRVFPGGLADGGLQASGRPRCD